MPFHHVAIAVKNPARAHKFYDTGAGLFAIWDLRGIEGVAVEPGDWRGGMSTAAGLPYWVNHIAFDCKDIDGLQRAKQRWLDHGYHVSEVKHEFIHSRDPDGTLVEFTYDTQMLGQADIDEAYQLLDDRQVDARAGSAI